MFDIRPALTAEEWDSGSVKIGVCDEVGAVQQWLRIELSDCGESQPMPSTFEGRERHAIAALALYQQPFGFTREDVVALRDITSPAGWRADYDYSALADRIEALLPPEVPPSALRDRI